MRFSLCLFRCESYFNAIVAVSRSTERLNGSDTTFTTPQRDDETVEEEMGAIKLRLRFYSTYLWGHVHTNTIITLHSFHPPTTIEGVIVLVC